jgi:hypothetical protein
MAIQANQFEARRRTKGGGQNPDFDLFTYIIY